MLKDVFLPIALALITSMGVGFGFVEFLITRKDTKLKDEKKDQESKDEKIEEITKVIDELRSDFQEFKIHSDNTDRELALSCSRLELMLLMEHYPDDQRALFTIGYTYFIVLNGDLYMTSQFLKHCRDRDWIIPSWFEECIRKENYHE